MKKLKGMKNSISSFENKILLNLESIQGGNSYGATESRPREETQVAGPAVDYNVFKDSGKVVVITVG